MTDESGLYYMRARFYSPEIKRFVNQDVLLGNIAEGQTLNRFAFVTGNPISFVDPFGLFGDYIWDIPVITYDIYYGISEGDWTPLGIDLPLAIAPGIPAGVGILGCGIKNIKNIDPSTLHIVGSTQPELYKETLDAMIDLMKQNPDDFWSAALRSDGPIEIWEINGKRFLYNGNHRFFAALQAGVKIPVESIVIKSKSGTDIPTFILDNMTIVE